VFIKTEMANYFSCLRACV